MPSTPATEPSVSVVSVSAGGPNTASGGFPGHISTCVWPAEGCQAGFWATKLQHARVKPTAKSKGLITTLYSILSVLTCSRHLVQVIVVPSGGDGRAWMTAYPNHPSETARCPTLSDVGPRAYSKGLRSH